MSAVGIRLNDTHKRAIPVWQAYVLLYAAIQHRDGTETLSAGLIFQRTPVTPSNLHDPARMTASQRRTEAAVLLALGLYRLRDGNAHGDTDGAASPVCLGFDAAQRVYVDPTNRSPQA
jgi:hypothetical protein